MPDIKQALKDFVATSNSGKYKTEEELMSKFPELKGYDTQALRDYVTTSNSGKYKTEEELNSKFPEIFGTVKKKGNSVALPSRSGGSTSPSPSAVQKQVENPFAQTKPTNYVEPAGVEPIKMDAGVFNKNVFSKSAKQYTENKQYQEKALAEKVAKEKAIAEKAKAETPDLDYNTSNVVKKYQLTPEQFDVANNTFLQYQEKAKKMGAKVYNNFDDFAEQWNELNKEKNEPFIEDSGINIVNYFRLIKKAGEKQIGGKINEFTSIIDNYIPAFSKGLQEIDVLKQYAEQGNPEAKQKLQIYNEYMNAISLVDKMPAEDEFKRDEVKKKITQQYTAKFFNDPINDDWNNKLIKDVKNAPRIDRADFYGYKMIESADIARKIGVAEEIGELPEWQKGAIGTEDLELYDPKRLTFEPKWYDHAIGGAVALISDPLLYTTGGVGSLAVGVVKNQIIKQTAKKIVLEGVKKETANILAKTTTNKVLNTFLKTGVESVLKGGTGFALYEGTMDATQQAIEMGLNPDVDFDYVRNLKAQGHGFMVGGTTSLISPFMGAFKGYSVNKIAKQSEGYFNKISKGEMTLAQAEQKIASASRNAKIGEYGLGVTMFGGEVELFTELALKGGGDKSWGEEFATQLALIGILKGKGELFGGMKNRAMKKASENKTIRELTEIDENGLQNLSNYKIVESVEGSKTVMKEAETSEQFYEALRKNPEKADEILRDVDVPLKEKLMIIAETTGKVPTKIQVNISPEGVELKGNVVILKDSKNGTLLEKKTFKTENEAIEYSTKLYEETVNAEQIQKYENASFGDKTKALLKLKTIDENYTKDAIETALGTPISKRDVLQNEMIDKLISFIPDKKTVTEKHIEQIVETDNVGDIINNSEKAKTESLLNAENPSKKAEKIIEQRNEVEALKEPFLKENNEKIDKLTNELLKDPENDLNKEKGDEIVRLEKENTAENERLNQLTIEELKAESVKKTEAPQKVEVEKAPEITIEEEEAKTYNDTVAMVKAEAVKKSKSIAGFKQFIKDNASKLKDLNLTEKDQKRLLNIYENNSAKRALVELDKMIDKKKGMGRIPTKKQIDDIIVNNKKSQEQKDLNNQIKLEAKAASGAIETFRKMLSSRAKELKALGIDQKGINEIIKAYKDGKPEDAMVKLDTFLRKNEQKQELEQQAKDAKDLKEQFKRDAKVASKAIKTFTDFLDARKKELKDLGVNDKDVNRLLKFYNKNTPEKTLEKLDELIENKDYSNDIEKAEKLQKNLKNKNYIGRYNKIADMLYDIDPINLSKEALKDFNDALADMTKKGITSAGKIRDFMSNHGEEILNMQYSDKTINRDSKHEKAVDTAEKNMLAINDDSNYKDVSKAFISIEKAKEAVDKYIDDNSYTFDVRNNKPVMVNSKTGEVVNGELPDKMAKAYQKYKDITNEASFNDYAKNVSYETVKDGIDKWAKKNEYTFDKESKTFVNKNGEEVETKRAKDFAIQYDKISEMNEAQLKQGIISKENIVKESVEKAKDEAITEIKSTKINKKDLLFDDKYKDEWLDKIINPNDSDLKSLTASELNNLIEVRKQLELGHIPEKMNAIVDAMGRRNIDKVTEKGFFTTDKQGNKVKINDLDGLKGANLRYLMSKTRKQIAFKFHGLNWEFIDRAIGKDVRTGETFSRVTRPTSEAMVKAEKDNASTMNFIVHGKEKISEFKAFNTQTNTYTGRRIDTIRATKRFIGDILNEKNTKGKETLISMKKDLHTKQEAEFNELNPKGITYKEFEQQHNGLADKTEAYNDLVLSLKNKAKKSGESSYLLTNDKDLGSYFFNLFDFGKTKDSDYQGKKGLYSVKYDNHEDLSGIKDIYIEFEKLSREKNQGKSLSELKTDKEFENIMTKEEIEYDRRITESYKKDRPKAEVVAFRQGKKIDFEEWYTPFYAETPIKDGTDIIESITGRSFKNVKTNSSRVLDRTDLYPKPIKMDAFVNAQRYFREQNFDFYAKQAVKDLFSGTNEFAKKNEEYANIIHGMQDVWKDGLIRQENGSGYSNFVKIAKNTVSRILISSIFKPVKEYVVNPVMVGFYSGKIQNPLTTSKYMDLRINENSSHYDLGAKTFVKETEYENIDKIYAKSPIQKIIKETAGTVRSSVAYTNNKVTGFSDGKFKAMYWNIEFENAFKKAKNGEKFNLKEYTENENYREQNKDYIKDAVTTSDILTSLNFLPSLKWQSRQQLNILGRKKAIKIDTTTGAMAYTVASFSTHQFDQIKYLSGDLLKGTNEGHTRALAGITGILLSGATYGYMGGVQRALTNKGLNGMLGKGTDKDDEDLESSLNPYNLVTQAVTQLFQLPMAKSAIYSRFATSLLMDMSKHLYIDSEGLSSSEKKEREDLAKYIEQQVSDTYYVRSNGWFEEDKDGYGNKYRASLNTASNFSPYFKIGMESIYNIAQMAITLTAENDENTKTRIIKGTTTTLTLMNMVYLPKDVDRFIDKAFTIKPKMKEKDVKPDKNVKRGTVKRGGVSRGAVKRTNTKRK